ncbi:hypothetical protein D0N36_10345 [Hymenobacter lapidiphilus]|uniref:hypothetical protein n=1 Tax=Hymenobacter sp. CCM 8763 TaxID=2303334 RepID=UPI000E34FD08|nr:hypothetical protein [Hymenobacter sp. CCM 8763]RFP65075.1 hypothetical protein D0N36_10345 [Hymenobacter sp. CCM 8763]
MNKNYLRRNGLVGLLGLSATALLLASCGDTAEIQPQLQPDYYPLSVGSVRIYDVADTTWRDNVPTASRFQFREQVLAAPEPDAAGKLVYQVVRSRRATAAGAWQPDSVLTVTVAPLNVTEQFNNRRTVALVLPAVEGKSWNYNAFNSLDTVVAVTRFYQQVNQPFSITRNGKTYTYPNTITTINDLANSINAVESTIQRTTFALGVGPVNRVSRRYKNDCSGAEGCRSPFVRKLGQSRNQVLIESSN